MNSASGDHTETVDIDFDPRKTSYETLLNHFWKSHNPTVQHRNQYMSAIFYHGNEQKLLAEQTKREQQAHQAQPIATKILPAETFYEAEDYHQKYILRQHPSVLRKLGLTDAELIKSHTAARLNGYLGGFGTLDNFEKEYEDMKLTSDQVKYIREQITKKHRY